MTMGLGQNDILAVAAAISADAFGIFGRCKPLVGWANQNFLVETEDGARFVLKVSEPEDGQANFLAAHHAALLWLRHRAPELSCPQPVPTSTSEYMVKVSMGGTESVARMFTYVEGKTLAELGRPNQRLLAELGQFVGRLDVALDGFTHPAVSRRHDWDLTYAPEVIDQYSASIADPSDRQLVDRFASRFASDWSVRISGLRRGVIHNDANDHNVVVDDSGATPQIAGIIDFGDLVDTCIVFESAIAATYAMLGAEDPMMAASEVIAGYHQTKSLTDAELEVLFAAIVLRLCVSVSLSAHRSRIDPDDAYLTISEAPAWHVLRHLESVSPHAATQRFRQACRMTDGQVADVKSAAISSVRAEHIGPNLSVSYDLPLHIVTGSMQYLYDAEGREFLDTVNNVCHVGHCHPRVVRAAQAQTARLNTNTRYLHELLGEYASRLCETLPEKLNVCYLVCSGSEANELALRLARAYTGHHDVIVVDGAYHGNTNTLIDLSPYKHNRKGGTGTPEFVQVAKIPDVYRGDYPTGADVGQRYAKDVTAKVSALQDRGKSPAAFFCESVPSCAGQIVLPRGYLTAAYSAVRAAGGVCVADEVQVGFGRVGSRFWGFELQDVVPDIVTMGKPIGNGHPMAAVVTTREIAAAFDNGMEYFNTFGGNPVSCAIGLSVLDVIRDEHLQNHAESVGEYFLAGLRTLKNHELVGDVRGVGLFLGVELVRDRSTKTPATREAKTVVESLKAKGILASTDGPFENVIKIKPPLCFTKANADHYTQGLDDALRAVVSER